MMPHQASLMQNYGYLVVLHQSDKNGLYLELEAILPKAICKDFAVNEKLMNHRRFMEKIDEALCSFELSEMDEFWLDAYKRQLRCYVITLY